MSEASQSSGYGLVLPGVLLALVTGSTIVALRPPLESARPSLSRASDITELPTITGTFATHARLWEDPISVAREHHANQKPECLCQDELQKELRKLAGVNVRMVVMPVWVRGGPYDDDKEQRLRTRYAVETALMAEHFVAIAPDRVTYTVFPVSVVVKVSGQGAPPRRDLDIVVPIKAYRHEDDKTAVLVLWLSESDLGDWPLATTGTIIDQLFGTAVLDRSEIAVIGPTNSDVRARIAISERRVGEVFHGRPVAVYSSHATSYKTAEPDRKSEHVPLIPIIGNDEALARILRTELTLRGAWGNDRRSNDDRDIVLIAENDTRYGRDFPETIRDVFQMRDDQLRVFGYLRGIDGQTPTRPRDGKPKEPGKEEAGLTKPPRPVQEVSPTGPPQLDYLERLARQVGEVFAIEQRKGRHIAAIGVVGTDIYDKLLVLRALRKSFPNTLFFTTDLDTELCRPSEYATTRNLIVVSHFGLELHPDFKAPSFRDSYQTATYLACRFALRDGEEHRLQTLRRPGAGKPGGEPSGSVDGWPVTNIPPLVFEIGRSGPYQLTEVDGSVHPPRHRPWWLSWSLLWLLVFVLAVAGIGAWFSDTVCDLLLYPAAGLLLFPASVVRRVSQCLPAASSSVVWCRRVREAASTHSWGSALAAYLLLTVLLALTLALVGLGLAPGGMSPVRPAIVVVAVVIGLLLVLGIGAAVSQQWRGEVIDLAAALVFPFVRIGEGRLGDVLQRQSWIDGVTVYGIILLLVGLVFASVWCHAYGEEPMDFTEGISVWPTIYIRFLAFVVSIFLIGVIWTGFAPPKSVDGSKYGWFFRRGGEPTIRLIESSQWYVEELSVRRFIVPVAVCWLTYMFAGTVLFTTLGVPVAPYRGWWTGMIEKGSVYLAVSGLVALMFVVLQSHHSFRELIREVGKEEFRWQDDGKTVQNHLGYPLEIAEEVGRVTAIAAGTRQLAYTGYFPFVVMALILVARITFFDKWTFTAPLAIINLTNAVLLVYAAISIRREAGRLQEKVLERLHRRLAIEQSNPEGASNSYKEAIEYVKNIREGAFRSWLQDPIFESLGGISGLLILEQILLPYF